MLERGLAELSIVHAGDHHHGGVGPGRAELLEQAVAGLVRKPDVEQGDRVIAGLEEAPGLGGGQGHVAFKPTAPQGARHHPGQRFVVVHHEHSFRDFGACQGHAV